MGREIFYKPFEFSEAKAKIVRLMPDDIEEIREQLHEVKDLLQKLNEKNILLENGITRIREAVAGEPGLAIKGIAERLQDLEDKVKHYDKIYYKIIGAGLIISFIWSIVMAILFKIWDKIF